MPENVENKDYDLEAVYDEKINPLMAQVIAICNEHRIPLLCSFQYSANDSGTDDAGRAFCSTFGVNGREAPELSRAIDIIRNGLPENRVMAYTITTTTVPDMSAQSPDCPDGGSR